MLASARATATSPFEVCVWLDDDDPDREVYPEDPAIHYGSGPRPVRDDTLYTSGLWSSAWGMASGDIAMLAADDIIFRTPGWDTAVESAFAAVPDHILLAYCDDGTKLKRPVLPFISRAWIDVAGEFTPPDFQGWFADTWLWAIAAEIKRVAFLPEVLIKHHQKTGSDQTYRDGQAARASEGGPYAIMDRFYDKPTTARRDAQTARLRAQMTSDTPLIPAPRPAWVDESLLKSARGRQS